MHQFGLKEIFSVTLILFSVIDIIGSLPIIINLRSKPSGIHPLKATLIAVGIMIGFLFIGEKLLSLFGVDVASFSIAGGLILFFMGLEMVLGIEIFKSNSEHESSTIVPLAFPLIAGPGTMTTIISLRAEYSKAAVLTGIILNIIFVYITLKSSGWISRKLGRAGANVLRQVFGIICLAIAIKLIRNSLMV